MTSRTRRRRMLSAAALLLTALCALTAATARPASAATVTVALAADTTTPAAGQTVTFTATVTSDTATPAGSVQFLDGDTKLARVTLVPAGPNTAVATFATSWAAGTAHVKAVYYASILPGPASNVVDIAVGGAPQRHPTSLVLTASPSSVIAGNDLELTATVATSDGSGVVPTGTVDFFDNGLPLGSGTLSDGRATITHGGFAADTRHSFTAAYGGDATSAGSSGALSLTITGPPTAVQTIVTAGASPNPVPPHGTTTLTAHVEQVGTAVVPPAGEEVTFWNDENGSLIGTGRLDANGDASVELGGWAVGTYAIRATYVGDAANLSGSATFQVRFASKAATVVAPSPTVVYGGAVPALQPTYGGLEGGASAPATPAVCTTTATGSSPAGTYPVTCSGASDPDYTFGYEAGTLTVAKAPLTVTPVDATMVAGAQVPALGATITGFANGETVATSGVTGSAACTTTATSSSPAGSYPITCAAGTLAAANYTFAVSGQGTLTVTAERARTTIVAWVSGPVLAGRPVLLSATLLSGLHPLRGEPVTLTLGSESCVAETNLLGTAFCSVTPTGPLGPTTSTATFAGDNRYGASSDTNAALLYALPAGGGAFVVGDRSATGKVTFWGARWASENRLSGRAANSSFKGFVRVDGDGWTSRPGNSSTPPDGPLPSYMAVLVTGSVDKVGSSFSGRAERWVIVKTDSGYDGNPGHAGTGTVVATLP